MQHLYKRARLSCLVASLGAIGTTSLTYASTTTQNPSDLTTNILALKCYNPEGTITVSRIAVLDVSELDDSIHNKKYDFALVAGHGLNADRPCHVSDFNGNKSRLLFHTLPRNYESGTQNDWGLIKFKKLKTRNMVRYKLIPAISKFDDLEDLDEVDVNFARARSLPDNLQTCQIKSLTFSNTTQSNKVLSHNCMAIGGQSGSPLTYEIGNETRLIGLHLGTLWMINSPLTGKPDRVGFVKVFDEGTINQIKVMLHKKTDKLEYAWNILDTEIWRKKKP